MVQVHNLRQLDLRLTADPSRVVIRPFHIAPEPRDLTPAQSHRALRIVEAVRDLSETESANELAAVTQDFAARHWQTKQVFFDRCARIVGELGLQLAEFSATQRELIGAYFCHEYSFEAAAIMNPSVAPHPDQSGLPSGYIRFVLSLRTVGEGHISSISFREGTLGPDGELRIWPQPDFTIAAESEAPGSEGAVVAHRPASAPLSGCVLFPFTRAQRNGLEDLRLVQFEEENGSSTYYGTYTAYSGAAIRSELLSTGDFSRFALTPIEGDAAASKGMALFPRRIGGAYAMLGRQDGESVFFMQSDTLHAWSGGERILLPKMPWELVQIGNCGSPVELDEGWLVLTHGVGAMRKYSLGAALLDKDAPRKVLARLKSPLLSPSAENREGYVPNVLYTCGALRHGKLLFLPFGVADSAVSFALLDLPSLLADMD